MGAFFFIKVEDFFLLILSAIDFVSTEAIQWLLTANTANTAILDTRLCPDTGCSGNSSLIG